MLATGPFGAPPQSDVAKATLPRAFGQYELLEEIARGGMGIVYRARQLGLNRLVALKVIRDSQLASHQAMQRFQLEAEAAAKLHHPNIVPIYEFGEVHGQHFLSMKLVDGMDLGKQLHGRPMEARPLAQLMATLAQAIHHAHQRGVLHRDLKPANVLIDASGQPSVTDFGLAKLAGREATLTLSSDVLGSPNYMAPEQAAGGSDEVTMAVDIYSLGAIMYELLTGRAPFRAETPLKTMRKVMEEEPQAPRTLYQLADADLQTICLKCMEKHPRQRYGSAEALADDLGRWLRKEPIHARPATPTERLGKWVRRNPKVATLTTLLLLALAAGLGGVLNMNVRLSSANHLEELANVRLAAKVRDFEWQKVEDLVAAGKRSDALALLSGFLRGNPRDEWAATRLFSMLNGGNFALPIIVLFQQGAPVNSVSLSQDGRRVLTAADDGQARVWDLRSGRLLSTCVHSVKVNKATFADEDRLVLTSSQGGSFHLWDSVESKVVLEFPKAPPDSTVPPALSRDQRRAAMPDSDNSVRVWDLPGRRSLGGSIRLTDRPRCVAFGRDPNVIAAGCKDGTVGVWRVADSRLITPPIKLPYEVSALEFSPDGGTFAAASAATITLWDTHTWLKLKELKAQDGQVLMIAFTPDGQRLIDAPFSRAPNIWDVASGKTIGQPIQAEQPHCYFQISPNGKSLATRSQSGVVRIWDAMTGLAISEPFEHEGPVTDLAFTSDGLSLLTCSQDGNTLALNIQHGRPSPSILKTDYRYSSACFTRDGKRVIGTSGATALMFDATTGTQVGKPMIHADPIYRMQVSPDGRKLATASWNGTARVWDLATCEPKTPLLRHTKRLHGVAFSPDNRLLATASEDATARIWDSETGEPKSPPLRHDADVLSVAFSGNSRALLTAAADGTARLWSTDDGHALWPDPIRHKGIVWSAQFDPAGQRIVTASADKSARVWDAQSREPLTPPIRHQRGVAGARFSPDGRWVLTSSEDGTARVWDSRSGEAVSQPMRHRDIVTSGSFSPDGTRVLTGSKDGVVRLWDAATGYPLSESLQNGGSINVVEFSPDGRRFLSFADKDALRIWDVVIPPVPVPSWFCDLVEAVAGKRLSANREIGLVGRDSLQPLRQRFASVQESDFYSRWAKWFLWERMSDPAPEFVP